MYVIVEINGQQFKAEEGKKLFVHHIQNAENGATVEFEKVLLVEQATLCILPWGLSFINTCRKK